MRSRSLLFLGLGVAVSAAYGNDIPLQMAENGFISLNVPLTNSRIGSASTRTTHPHFIKLFRRLLALLGISVRINLPYRFVTKGEMLDQTLDPLTLAEGLPGTMSCSHPESGRFRGGVKPCGYCVPCIIRLASVHAASLNDEPPLVDILTNPPAANSNMGSDFRAFQMAIARTAHENNREAGLRVLESGPLSSDEVPDFSALYLRGLKEVERFLNSG